MGASLGFVEERQPQQPDWQWTPYGPQRSFFNELDEMCIRLAGGATERVRYLVDQWRFSWKHKCVDRGPVFPGNAEQYKREDGTSNFYDDCCFPNPNYADFTLEEKKQAYHIIMVIIFNGGG